MDDELPCFEAQPVAAEALPRCALGEAATWSVARQALLWTDIEGRRLWSLEPASGQVRHWTLPGRLGSFALTADPQRLLCAFEHELAWLDLTSSRCETLAEFQPGDGVRANDGRCDRSGNFIFGTLDEARGPQVRGRWWRLSRSGGLAPLGLPPVAIPNGLAFSPDGSRLYFCDSTERRVHCAGYDATTGELGPPEVFAPVERGEPDGATVDAQGRYWSAHWGAGEVVARARDGRPVARVKLSASQPSCVAFGGAGLSTLYITTARVGLDALALAPQPDAGRVFAVALPWAGLAEPVVGLP